MPDVNALIEQGHNNLACGNYDLALEQFQEAVQLEHDCFAACHGLGLSYFRLNDFENAVEYWRQSLKINSKSIVALCWQGIAYKRLDQLSAEEGNFEFALSITPKDYQDWYCWGLIYLENEDLEKAEEYIQKSITLEEHNPWAWNTLGNIQREGADYVEDMIKRYNKALESYDKALEISPNHFFATYSRGFCLSRIGNDIEALRSIEKALKLNSDDCDVYRCLGTVYCNIKDYDKSIKNYNKAIELESCFYAAYCDRGNIYFEQADYSKAIEDYNKAIKLKPDYPNAYFSRGRAYLAKGRECDEKAIADFDKTIELKPDFPEAYYGHGNIFYVADEYGKAISCYETALKLKQNQFWHAWHSRSVAIRHHQSLEFAIFACQRGIDSLLPTHWQYEYGCGKLYDLLGQWQYELGREKTNPLLLWQESRKNHEKSRDLINPDKYPEDYFENYQKLLTVCVQLEWPGTPELLADANERFNRFLNRESNDNYKTKLEKKFSGLKQLLIYRLAEKDSAKALEWVEERKNRCLGALREGWLYKPPRPSYNQIQNLINSHTAIIYWHISPAAVTTFIIKDNDQPPDILSCKLESISEYQDPLFSHYPPVSYQLYRFEKWIKKWKQNYLDPPKSSQKDDESILPPKMDGYLEELQQILDIDFLCGKYLNNIQQVILVPHRELHLLPLHALFPQNLITTYLPSAQVGLDLQYHPSIIDDYILCVEDPDIDSQDRDKKEIRPLWYAKREIEGISCFYQNNRRLMGRMATQSVVVRELNKKSYNYFHFTGHGTHNEEDPRKSILYLSGEDKLLLEDIFKLDLSHYFLICLSACETGITTTQSIIDEYIGLNSGFLSAGATHVISTLWKVEDSSSGLLMIQFHRLLKDKKNFHSPAQALSDAQEWLQNLTYKTLGEWCRSLAAEFDTIEHNGNCSENFRRLASEAETKFDDGDTAPPYKDSYHWAGFTITGKVPGG
jgi:CHAT domain-containing protein/tetratricopeptide (TPR) repeat protein